MTKMSVKIVECVHCTTAWDDGKCFANSRNEDDTKTEFRIGNQS